MPSFRSVTERSNDSWAKRTDESSDCLFGWLVYEQNVNTF